MNNQHEVITTAYLWCDGHSISITACGVGGKCRGSSFQKGALHTYTLRLG